MTEIKITAEFGSNKVQGEFEDFDEVYEWLAIAALLHKEKKEKQCIGFMGETACEDEAEPTTDEKEKK